MNTKLLIFTFLLCTGLHYSKDSQPPETLESSSKEILTRFSSMNLLDSIEADIRAKCLFPEIVIAQMKLETGNLECTNCSLDHNNLFGFRWRGKYLEFETWQESVDYYSDWQGRHFKDSYYYQFLKDRGYATDPNYISKLKDMG